MSLILYHYTSAHVIDKVRARGLTKGALPWNSDALGNPRLRRGFQWLTTSPVFNDQAWCTLGQLPFAKNAYRVTVAIPSDRLNRVIEWRALCDRYRPESAEYLNATGGDTACWRLFVGPIPPSWFIEVCRNTGEVMRAPLPIIG